MNDIYDKVRGELFESAIDYPRDGLAQDVWGDDGLILPEVKAQIINHLKNYRELDLESLSKEMRVVGSIGTNQYSDDADIDLHLIIDKEQLPQDKTAEEYQKEVKKFFDETDTLYIGEHPLEVYMQYAHGQEEGYASAIYDLKTDTWQRGPLILDFDFDPFEYYKHIEGDVQEQAMLADVEMGALMRGVKDYRTMKEALAELPIEDKKKLAVQMVKKLDELTNRVERLAAYRQEWKDERQEASAADPEDVKENPDIRKSWRDKNAKFKFIQRYGYMDIIVQLEKLIKDDKKITDNEVASLENTLRGWL